MSPALRVALSIAAIWEAKNPAWFSSMAEKIWTVDVARQQRRQDGLLVRLVLVGRALQVDGRRAPATCAGISCWAVGIWLTTERKRL